MKTEKERNKELSEQYPALAARALRDERSPLEQLRYENEKAIRQYDNKYPFHNGSDPSIDPKTGSRIF